MVGTTKARKSTALIGANNKEFIKGLMGTELKSPQQDGQIKEAYLSPPRNQ
jgi:hypothetical protein